MNFEKDDEWILNDTSKTLQSHSIGLFLNFKPFFYFNNLLLLESETEISYFNREEYENYKKNPEVKW